jgi:hypothetical protein
MDILSIAQQGLSRADDVFDKAAKNVVAASLPQSQPPSGDSLSLSDQAVALLQAKAGVEANLALVHAGDEMSRKLNLLA